ncbi:UDP-glucose 4-epimerase GalE [Myroides sp. LJL115]
MKRVLVTGGLGFIGSHSVVELQQQGYEVIIADDLSNASLEVLDGITRITSKTPLFEKVDLRDKGQVATLFEKHPNIDGVIHFAASKAVGESMQKPLMYYENNLFTLINVLEQMGERNIDKLIFSSSCTVYGYAEQIPINENESIKSALSPYGNTKQIGEEIIQDVARVSNLQSILLRYFNPIGAHDSIEIGESPLGVPYNLIPYITQTASGKREFLSIYGDDYNTPDGTCVRDYIHVVDLAKAHVLALSRLFENRNQQNVESINVGNGRGYSVLELVKSFEKANGITLPYKFMPRRPGDVDEAWADNTKARELLGWQPTYELDQMLKSAWEWEVKSTKK